MQPQHLLADPTSIRLEKIIQHPSSLTLVVRATRAQAECPRCVDLERCRVIDLLADREAGTLASWLRAHPGVEVVSRDRSPSYASGINEGAPAALRVADRFHLLMNVREAVEKVMMRQNRFLRSRTLTVPPFSAPAPKNAAYAGCRLRLEPHL